MAHRILIIEDEEDLVATMAYNLEREGFETVTATLGHEGIELALAAPTPDLILLDLMLPDMPGTEVCRQIRADARTRKIPLIMVTAKSDEIDRVVGFEVGADDYVVKPFSVRELLLRIRAVLRRAQPVALKEDTLSLGRLRIDIPGHKVWVEEEPVRLTALEFKLLQTFVERKGRVQTRESLLSDVWGMEADITTRTVDTHVKRLRDKLGAAGTYIETIRGVGYRLQTEPGED
ncbi:MAG: DNA-binding response regulator [Deltaproteobacteria bacterium HGW-Deltaproteobacteria-14]|jgi:two-component system phosphate regulon response regulator PhoB|nr:MAG: DNA-binding response regulator [Deltaproteobacteria bacterium HGW-Deltaproteobacteria-14]